MTAASVVILGSDALPAPVARRHRRGGRARRGPAADAGRDRHRGAVGPERRPGPDGGRRHRAGPRDRRAGGAGRPRSRAGRRRDRDGPARPARQRRHGPRRIPALRDAARRARHRAARRVALARPRSPTPTASPRPQLVAHPDRESDTRPLGDPEPLGVGRRLADPDRVARRRRRSPSPRRARLPRAGRATVRGVVIAEAGRLGTPRLLAIGDATGGLPVRLADGQVAPDAARWSRCAGSSPPRTARPSSVSSRAASRSSVTGTFLRPSRSGPAPWARRPRAAWLASAGPSPRRRPRRRAATSPSRFAARTARRCGSWPTRRLVSTRRSLRKGTTATVTGIVGQRASRKGALDGYRLWVRDPEDVLGTLGRSARVRLAEASHRRAPGASARTHRRPRLA